MSDYLWDKSGEADKDIERLEDLLGNLRHQKKPLALPPEILSHAPRRRRPFWPALAAAAALAFVALAGLWLGVLRTRNKNANAPLTARSTTATTAKPEQAQQTTNEAATNQAASEAATPERETGEATVTTRHDETVAAVTTVKKFRPFVNERAAASQSSKRRERLEVNREMRRAREAQAVARQRTPTRKFIPGEAQRDFQAANVTAAEQQAAKEQLMLALRLTSAKLSLVQRKTQTATTPGGSKPAPDEQNKLDR
ncbi:MAG TPA: hypothetical protein VNA19_02440 [Pyrinomonadaceae bacterium]|jgi:hypothetical protein|nr:hypothetical protein [Pyrinomonadaceae bacterium]